MENKKNYRYPYVYSIVIVVLLITIVLLLVRLNNRMYNTNKFLAQLIVSQNQKSPVDLEYGPNDIVLGRKDAPVDIYVYTSYRCVYCKEFFETTFKTLKKEYVDEGIAKFIIKNIGYSSDSISLLAAKASYCAYAEGQFSIINMKLLEQYDVLNETEIVKWMYDLDIDTSSFKICLENKMLENLIFENRKEARAIGARGTPAFVIGNNVINGKRPVSKFRELIEVEMELCE